VLQKSEAALGGESLDRFRNLMSRIFAPTYSAVTGASPGGLQLCLAKMPCGRFLLSA
jgi:hypothetical protein